MSTPHELGPLPEPSEMDGSRWGYTSEDMENYALGEVARAVEAQRERWATAAAEYASELDEGSPLDGSRSAAVRELARRMSREGAR